MTSETDTWDPRAEAQTDPRAGLVPSPVPAAVPRPGWMRPNEGDLVALVFESRSGGVPHVVTRTPADGAWVCTTCMTVLSLSLRPIGCWATQAARRIAGAPDPVGT